MFLIRNLTRVSPTTSSIVTRFRNSGSSSSPYTLASRFCTAQETQIQSPASSNGVDRSQYEGLRPTREGEKPRVVVLGSGWAGCRLMKGIDTSLYDVVCVSPRNHMVFTPLLASTCVGTLEFRSVAEPITSIQPAISREPGSYFFLANCSRLDADAHEVHCETLPDGLDTLKPRKFKIAYDKLVVASGAEASTFGIHGVMENAIFLREVHHAQEIRRKLLLNLMLSDTPCLPKEEKQRLLHCVVVGGGPTGVEFSGELSDFIKKDVRQRYSHVKDDIHVTLIEARDILSSFDDRLRRYAIKQLNKSGVRFVRGIVKDVMPQKLILDDGTEVPYGLLVWSTGVGPSPFVRSLGLPKDPGGRLVHQDHSIRPFFAIFFCISSLIPFVLCYWPIKVAEREGKYLANLLNEIAKANGGRANSAKEIELGVPFVYKHLGSMATIGRYKALVDLRESKDAKGISMTGFVSWFIWRSAYLTRVISWRNRFYVAINWFTTFVFGRDISRI
ncbi:PREDICTED: internal alternative NAD(P)H-ubiquinone oxidoreductase A2, mitochondrial-like [Camelina sativa]|uniref:NADH:ubiquinone reductase (non-electrogenic) n=1 Tax=Camelina sativa TaxID=90675 RepID=A0ABM1Q8G1_CAMSA|nr:PREDICTED: internal alternative NAD(P)H-ubiquinone oxidoreductase A2, mitochondrial-like [Camelina sativa]